MERLHEVLLNVPVLLVVHVTLPVGVVGAALVSVTVTVQLSVLLMNREDEAHETAVEYERKAVHAVPQGIGVGCSVVCMPVKYAVSAPCRKLTPPIAAMAIVATTSPYSSVFWARWRTVSRFSQRLTPTHR